jgi:hypothetical protein
MTTTTRPVIAKRILNFLEDQGGSTFGTVTDVAGDVTQRHGYVTEKRLFDYTCTILDLQDLGLININYETTTIELIGAN